MNALITEKSAQSKRPHSCSRPHNSQTAAVHHPGAGLPRYLQRSTVLPDSPQHHQRVSPQTEQCIRNRAGRGEPLGAVTRGHLERQWDADLSRVRLHTDANADQLAVSVDAAAFSVGQDIFMRSHMADDSSLSGACVLAHELAHTVQCHSQDKPGASDNGLSISEASDPLEHDAWRASHSALRGDARHKPTQGAESHASGTLHRVDPVTAASAGATFGPFTPVQLAWIQETRAMYMAAQAAEAAAIGNAATIPAGGTLATATTIPASSGAAAGGAGGVGGLGAGAALPLALAGLAGLGAGWAAGEYIIDPYLNRAKEEDASDHGASFTPGTAYDPSEDKPWYLF